MFKKLSKYQQRFYEIKAFERFRLDRYISNEKIILIEGRHVELSIGGGWVAEFQFHALLTTANNSFNTVKTPKQRHCNVYFNSLSILYIT